MKCQILFSWKKMENTISLLSAEFAHSIVNVSYITFCLGSTLNVLKFSNTLLCLPPLWLGDILMNCFSPGRLSVCQTRVCSIT